MAKPGKFRWKKSVAVLLLVGAVSGAVYWYFSKSDGEGTEYQTSPVLRGDLTQAVTATGQLNPVVNVQVGSQISGRIQRIGVDFNSTVKSNQVIAEIDPSTYKVSVLRAEAELANAKANATLTQVQADRANSLYTNHLISASDHDTAIAQVEQARAAVQSAQANLENARVDLSRCTIQSPVDGVVISRNVDVGQTVAASFNTPTLFLIAGDLTKMQIDALVSEADIGGVAVGQNVNFSVDAYPYRTFHGKVSQVRYGAMTNQNVVNYDCVIEVNNPDLKLLPGMTANVSIIVAERENALKVPNAALRFRPPEATTTDARTNAGPRTLAQGGPSGGEGGARRGFRQGEGGTGPGGGGPGGRGQGFGPRGPRGFGGEGGSGSGRARPERQLLRTVYVLPAKTDGAASDPAKPTPIQIKVGISDGVSTEVLEGLDEGAQVVTGVITPDTGSSSARTPRNPFGGGMRRF